MPSRSHAPAALAISLLSACSCGGSLPPGATPEPVSPALPPAPTGPTYEVHEWGLVRGSLPDRVSLSGPHVTPPPMPVAKPVLYFHRSGEGALEIDVTVEIPRGEVVEHWPLTDPATSLAAITWADVRLEAGACAGSRYPASYEPPCGRDPIHGCEAEALRAVETTDGDCLRWPQPPGGDGPGEAWNHLFYRAEVEGTPELGLRIEPQPDGTLRVTSTADAPIPGRLVRVRRPSWYGPPDAVAVAAPPAPGASAIVPRPSEPVVSGAEALAAALLEAGLTPDEVAAFRRAWDAELFGVAVAAAADLPGTIPVAAASPMPVVGETHALLWVLPAPVTGGLATVRFDPAPTAFRRAIVAWVDETRAP